MTDDPKLESAMSSRLLRRATVAHEVDETGEVVVFDEIGNRLLMLNQIGAAVWLLIDGERTGRDIAALIVETLGGERVELERVEHDIRAFVATLVQHGVVELVS